MLSYLKTNKQTNSNNDLALKYSFVFLAIILLHSVDLIEAKLKALKKIFSIKVKMEPHLRVIAFVLTIIATGVSIHYQTVLLQLTTYCESSSWSNNTPRGTYFPSAKHSSLTVELLATGTTSGNCTSIFGSYSPITPGVPKTKWEFMSHNFIHLKAWKCHVKKQSTPMVDNVLCMTTQRLKKKRHFIFGDKLEVYLESFL